MKLTDLFWTIVGKLTGQTPEQARCAHPEWMRDYRMTFVEDGTDYWEVCLNCSKEFHDE